jgi:hypothetical protein
MNKLTIADFIEIHSGDVFIKNGLICVRPEKLLVLKTLLSAIFNENHILIAGSSLVSEMVPGWPYKLTKNSFKNRPEELVLISVNEKNTLRTIHIGDFLNVFSNCEINQEEDDDMIASAIVNVLTKSSETNHI